MSNTKYHINGIYLNLTNGWQTRGIYAFSKSTTEITFKQFANDGYTYTGSIAWEVCGKGA